MALFEGEEMVDVTTPDGRTISVPRSIANMSTVQQIAPGGPVTSPQRGGPVTTPGEIPGGFTAPDFTPSPEDAGYSVPGVVEMGEPEVTPVTVMPEMDVKARPKVMKRLRADAAQRAASPQGKLDAAQNQQVDAANAEKAAIVGAADVEAAEQDVLADAKEERNKQIDDLFAKRATGMQQAADEQERKFGEVTRIKDKIAGFKVDRTHDSKTMASIGMILAALGTAINNTTYKRSDENPALKIYYEAIDRKVAGQMADLDQMGKIYGMTKDEVDMLKEKSKSKLEMWNTMIAGETEKSIRIVEAITARSASDKTKANAQMFIAQLQGRVAEKTLAATQWGLDFDQKDKHQKAQVAAQNYSTSVQDRHYKAEEQLTREKIYADKIAALAALKQTGDLAAQKEFKEASKEVDELGVKGADNKFLLTSEGRAMKEQAAKLDAEADALEANPDAMARSVASNQIAMRRQKAAELRGNADVYGVAKFRNSTVAKLVVDTYAAGQAMIDVIDDIRLMEAGRGLLGHTVDQQELAAKYQLLAVKGKAAFALGAWDKGTTVLSKNIYGEDPSKWSADTLRGYVSDVLGSDPEGYKTRLNAVATDIENSTRLQIQKHAVKWDGKDELFTRKKLPDLNTPIGKAASSLYKGSTPGELEAAAAPTTGGKVRDQVYAVGGLVGEPQYKANQRTAQDSGSTKYVGIGKDQEAGFDELLTAYKSGSPEDKKRAADQLVMFVVNSSEGRPDAAIGALHALDEHAPELGRVAKSALPKGSDVEKQVAMEDTAKIARAPVPPRELATMVIATMNDDGTVTAVADYQALSKRASAGDQDAKQALADIWAAGSKRKQDRALPRGSVFKGRR